MQTNFAPERLADPAIARSEEILRKCVHCGFCTATCPTYVLLGDELDSPRGRIYLIKEMLENDRPADALTVKHIDRCLSCLSCMTTCPSSVHYMHLVDHARVHIEKTYTRPFEDRWFRWMLATVLPRPMLFRLALAGAKLARPFGWLLPGRLKGLIAMAPATIHGPSEVERAQVFRARGKRRMRVALMTGCAQKALDPEINDATVRLLTRHGVDVVVPEGAGCCGSLTLHMGMDASRDWAAANIRAWAREMDAEGLDHIVINTSGCGTAIKDYGHLFRNDPELADDARRVSEITCDVTEIAAQLEIKPLIAAPGIKVAYHSACSLQHGQAIRELPLQLLREAGFDAHPIPESHICCGSAGTYNLQQPAIAARLQKRKVDHIESLSPDVIAAGNIGCLIQIGNGTQIPTVHTVSLLDWASGGPRPRAIEDRLPAKRTPEEFISAPAA